MKSSLKGNFEDCLQAVALVKTTICLFFSY